ncbi:peptidase, S41 family [Leptospira fainei serovar Hurstbridge str. BUT 6]|uniref:Peptidase, S41 family n=1 Tax=Leptospira fainei serovar Hurstbridge str. BUT 6 TaxID=1193011 RepID=S3UW90_9LEPT|nr:S41 family peptidase [Leptospira fainei]EPG74671.1 peptidase, S41 family [Leptospira fainei serovar Hurstbridge str. BUT 6]
MKSLRSLSFSFVSVVLCTSIFFCEPSSGHSKTTADFTLKDFDSVVKTVDRSYIDKNIDKNRAYKDAAIFALFALPHALYLYPESYFKDREKYEEPDDIFPGKTFKLSSEDKFIVFDPDYKEVEKIRDRKLKEEANKPKLSGEEVIKLVEREKVRKAVLSAKWEQTNFSKKDFDRVLAFIEKSLQNYSTPPLKDPFGTEETKDKEPFSIKDIYLAAANGYLSSLDPHSQVFLKAVWEESMAKIEDGSFEGIGAILSGGGNKEVVVENPLEGRPAVNAGVRAGDVILAVDGKSVKGMILDKVVERIKGKKGSTVSLTIRRKGVSGTLNIDVVRDTIEIKNIASKLIEGHNQIGYIKLTGFVKSDPSVDKEFVLHFKELEKQAQAKGTKLKALVLDLRNNPGGYLDLAIDLADMFITNGLIVSVKSPNRSPEDSNAKNRDLTDLPVAVLINAKSASASEIVASALKHHGRGLILGERSFGKATVQKLQELPGNGAYYIKLTQSRYYAPSGNTIQVVGVKPDVEVSAEEDGSFPFHYREENMWNHLPELPSAAEEKSHFDVKKLETWVKANGKAEKFIQEHKNDPIKPDYQLIRSIDFVEALINTGAGKRK